LRWISGGAEANGIRTVYDALLLLRDRSATTHGVQKVSLPGA